MDNNSLSKWTYLMIKAAYHQGRVDVHDGCNRFENIIDEWFGLGKYNTDKEEERSNNDE